MNKLITGLILIGIIGLVGCSKPSPKLHIGYTQNVSKEASNLYFKCLKAHNHEAGDLNSSYVERKCQAETFAVYAGVNGENVIKYFFYWNSDVVFTPCTEAKTKEEKNVCGLELKND